MEPFFAQGFGILFVLCLLSLLIDKFAGRSAKSAHTGTEMSPLETVDGSGERK